MCVKRKKGLLMEAVKLNNDMAKSSPSAAGFFYRRIGGTLFKVRIYTGSGYADTLDEKIPRLILNEMVTGAESYVKILSLTVSRLKNRCIPCIFWGTAIFIVVTKYSNLFFPFTFFLNGSHIAFGYELIIRSETTDFMESIRDKLPPV